MNSLFDSAGLAIVAYCEVAADGTSAATNSGVATAKTGTGVYTVTLPSDKTQSADRDLIFVQRRGSAGTPVTSEVDDTNAAVKTVRLTDGASLADGAFTVLILRTIVPPPAGAPA
jgi:hypothetical protein